MNITFPKLVIPRRGTSSYEKPLEGKSFMELLELPLKDTKRVFKTNLRQLAAGTSNIDWNYVWLKGQQLLPLAGNIAAIAGYPNVAAGSFLGYNLSRFIRDPNRWQRFQRHASRFAGHFKRRSYYKRQYQYRQRWYNRQRGRFSRLWRAKKRWYKRKRWRFRPHRQRWYGGRLRPRVRLLIPRSVRRRRL